MKYYLLPVLLYLSGCAASDPREGGLLGGLYGLQSHAYETRLQSRQEKLTAIAGQQHQIHRNIAKTQVLKHAQQQDITQLNHAHLQSEHEQQRLQMSIETLEQQLHAMQTERKKYQQMQAFSPQTVAQQVDEKRLQVLVRQTAMLRKQLEELLK